MVVGHVAEQGIGQCVFPGAPDHVGIGIVVR